MIVKIQRPDNWRLNSGYRGTVLIFNRDRSFFTEIPISPEIMRMLGGQKAAFFWVKKLENGEIEIERKVRWQFF